MKLRFWETRTWELIHPYVIAAMATAAIYLSLCQGHPIFENMRDINMVTMVMGTIAIGFLLTSSFLLTQRKNAYPVLNEMKRTGEYLVLMDYVHTTAVRTILLIGYASFGLFGFFTDPPTLSICIYVFLAASNFLEFRRVIKIMLMVIRGYGRT